MDEAELRRRRRALPPLEERIRAAIGDQRQASYYTVMHEVFPPELYPRAHRYQSNGGPPGCAMAFGAALRRMGAMRDYRTGKISLDERRTPRAE